MIANRYLHEYGATPEQLAKVLDRPVKWTDDRSGRCLASL